jgi:hypothetical protein
VSWLPFRLLTQQQAMTAIIVAENVAQGRAPDDQIRPQFKNWARELGLTASEAVRPVQQ